MSYKFVINSRSTAPGLPPSMNEGTIEVSEKNVDYEHQLVQMVFSECGEGHYTILSNLGEKHLKKIWKGQVEIEDEEDINYITFESGLMEKTWIKIKKPPISGRWKRCSRPERSKDLDPRQLLD